MIGLKRGTVKLVPYDSSWAEAFEEEKKLLAAVLGDSVIDIQHVGSTSIPGILAKPIIDVDVGVRSAKNFSKCIELLKDRGYEFRDNAYDPNAHILFVKGPEKKRTHYIHIVIHNGEIWKHDIFFRNFLRNHKKAASEYMKIKKDLAEKFGEDRGKYTKGKAEFIEKIISSANR